MRVTSSLAGFNEVNDIRNVVTLSIFAALGAAVVFNAGKVQPLVREVRLAWVQVINAVSGVNRGV